MARSHRYTVALSNFGSLGEHVFCPHLVEQVVEDFRHMLVRHGLFPYSTENDQNQSIIVVVGEPTQYEALQESLSDLSSGPLLSGIVIIDHGEWTPPQSSHVMVQVGDHVIPMTK